MSSRSTVIPGGGAVIRIRLFESCYGNAVPGVDLSRVKTYYVDQPKDTHSIHYLISDKLLKEGYSKTAGPELPQSSDKVDLICYVRGQMDVGYNAVPLGTHRNVPRRN